MAPKPKSKPTKIGGRIKVTAGRHKGSQPPQGAVLDYEAEIFNGKNVQADYKKIWRRKSLALERAIKLAYFSGESYMWEDILTERGWQEFAKFGGGACKHLCGEFLANITSIEEEPGKEEITSWVRGRNIIFTPDSISELCKIRRTEGAEFKFQEDPEIDIAAVASEILLPNQTWVKKFVGRNAINDRYLPLFLWSTYNLIPIGRTSEMDTQRGKLLWAIGTGKPIDLPLYIWAQVVECKKKKSPLTSIPFLVILTETFKKAEVDPEEFIFLKWSQQRLSKTSINKSLAQMGHLSKKRKVSATQSEGTSQGHSVGSEELMATLKKMEEQLAKQEEQLAKQEKQMEEDRAVNVEFHRVVLEKLEIMEASQRKQAAMLREMVRRFAEQDEEDADTEEEGDDQDDAPDGSS